MIYTSWISFKPYSAFLVTSYCHCAEKIVSACLCIGSASAERVGSSAGCMHMVDARLVCKSAMVGTEWGNSCPGCMNRLRKCNSYLK